MGTEHLVLVRGRVKVSNASQTDTKQCLLSRVGLPLRAEVGEVGAGSLDTTDGSSCLDLFQDSLSGVPLTEDYFGEVTELHRAQGNLTAGISTELVVRVSPDVLRAELCGLSIKHATLA